MRPSLNAFSKVNSISPWQVVTTKGQHILTQFANANAGISTATREGRQKDTRQYKATKTESGWIIGVAVGVAIVVALTIIVIGLIFMRRRGIICRPTSKEIGAHLNATYGVANADVSFTLPVVSTNEN
ncbi:hypothetical protein MAR_015064, partial [Mya arenaria]